MELSRKFYEAMSLMQNLCRKECELSPLKIKVMYFIDEYKRISPKTLLSKISIARPNLALLTSQLLERDLIYSETAEEDKRCKFFSLTQKGKDTLSEILNSVRTCIREEEVTEDLNNSLETLLKFLNKKF